MGKKNVKGLNITKKDILEAARAKALSYVVSAPKKKGLTPKGKKALAIYEVAKNVGGCQQDSLLKLLDVMTGLPVSNAKKMMLSEEVLIKGSIVAWCGKHHMKVIAGGTSDRTPYISLGGHNSNVMNKSGEMVSLSRDYAEPSNEEVVAFFDDMAEDAKGKIVFSYLG